MTKGKGKRKGKSPEAEKGFCSVQADSLRVGEDLTRLIWGFTKIRGTILGVPIVPIIRIIIFWGLHWGPLILGNYHIEPCRDTLGALWVMVFLEIRM